MREKKGKCVKNDSCSNSYNFQVFSKLHTVLVYHSILEEFDFFIYANGQCAKTSGMILRFL